MTYRVGLVGTGPKQRTAERGGGFAIGRIHAEIWKEIEGAKLVAACDIKEENLQAYLQDFGLTEGYSDYKEMFRQARLDIVDICTWPTLHYEMAMAAVEAGVKGIYLEKPMCLSLGEARQLVDACRENGVKLVVSHQRRLQQEFINARKWLHEGRIGQVLELDAVITGEDADLLSWGTHWFDLFGFLLDDAPAVSVMAQTDCSSGRIRYGHRVEDSALVEVEYASGIRCYLRGDNSFNQAPMIRIIGDKGMIEVGRELRGLYEGSNGWVNVASDPIQSFKSAFVNAMQDFVESIRENRPPLLSGELALRTTEVIMAAYESANRRARVRLPLDVEKFPLLKRDEFKQI